jgi:hypothetical protein
MEVALLARIKAPSLHVTWYTMYDTGEVSRDTGKAQGAESNRIQLWGADRLSGNDVDPMVYSGK